MRLRACIICRFLLMVFMFLSMNSSVSAQFFITLNSLESMVDAEQVALGESFAAFTSGLTSFKQNPATLAGSRYPTAYYSFRDNDINSLFENSNFKQFGLTFKTPLGTSNINYVRFNSFSLDLIDMTGDAGKIQYSDHTFSFNHAYQATDALALGVSLKWVDQNEDRTGNTEPFEVESQAAIAGDIGVTYRLNGWYISRSVKDSLTIGASLQNFGSDLIYSSSGMDMEYGVQLPRLFKIGFAYGLTILSDDEIPWFEYLLTAQYGRWLNATEFYEDDRDLGGLGTKVRFWEVLELNIGGFYQSYFTFYGDEDVLNIRYGMAVNLPFQRLGWRAPLTVKFA